MGGSWHQVLSSPAQGGDVATGRGWRLRERVNEGPNAVITDPLAATGRGGRVKSDIFVLWTRRLQADRWRYACEKEMARASAPQRLFILPVVYLLAS